MQTKLILNVTGFRKGAERQLATTLILASLVRIGFTWEDGTKGPRNTDADAIIINHPDVDSPNIITVIGKDALTASELAALKAEPNSTMFDATHPREAELFAVGVEYFIKLHNHKSATASEDAVVDDHLALPLGWSGRTGPDPIYTEEVEGVKISVCKHGVIMTTPKANGTPDEAKTERLMARARSIARNKFGLLV